MRLHVRALVGHVRGERAGINPSREWKRANFSNTSDQRWYHGETVIASIGQGYMLATPVQLANAAATVAMRGVRYRPHMVAAWQDPLTNERTLVRPERLDTVEISNEFYWDNIIAAMQDVMQGPQGTARAVGTGAPYSMAGKSGTAQVFSVSQDEEYDEEEYDEEEYDEEDYDDGHAAITLLLRISDLRCFLQTHTLQIVKRPRRRPLRGWM